MDVKTVESIEGMVQAFVERLASQPLTEAHALKTMGELAGSCIGSVGMSMMSEKVVDPLIGAQTIMLGEKLAELFIERAQMLTSGIKGVDAKTTKRSRGNKPAGRSGLN
jgi:hypothetical protein